MNKSMLDSQPIYTKQLITKKITVPFNKYSPGIVQYFIDYANEHFMGKCCKEGYISNEYVKIIKYSAPKMNGKDLLFDIVFEFNVYYPFEDQEIYTLVTNITKIGIKSVINLNEHKNPITVFVSRLQNSHISITDEDDDLNNTEGLSPYNNGDVIKIKIIGYRFEINDSSIYALGEVIAEK
uniref:DNA-Directed RNA polymerase Ii Subunit Rpb7 n=1 Tax=Florenciella sp. virus SA2 TaxID=3240092 RepID=A0AB39J8L6_9VIRU